MSASDYTAIKRLKNLFWKQIIKLNEKKSSISIDARKRSVTANAVPIKELEKIIA